MTAPVVMAIVFGCLCVLLGALLAWSLGRPPRPASASKAGSLPPAEEGDRELALHRQRLESVGEIASGIVHDLNNHLTSVIGYAELVSMLSDDAAARKHLDALVRAAGSAADLVRQVRTFSRGGRNPAEPYDVHKVLEEVAALLDRVLPDATEVVLALEAEKSTVVLEPTSLYQAVLNLAINAKEAMPRGGVITMRTRVVPVGGESGEPGVEIRVTDTGAGVPEAVADRLFEADCTTKPQGTGRGLAVVQRVVVDLGGTVRHERPPEGGASFVLVLPLSPSEEALDSTASGPVLKGSGRVLVVDDDEPVLEAIAELVETLGYDVVALSDPEAARDFYRREHGAVDLALVDINMPAMSGFHLFRELKGVNPHVKAFLITAASVTDIDHQQLDEDLLGVLQKPLRLANLSQMLNWSIRQSG